VTDLPSAEYHGIRFTAEHVAIIDGRVEAVSVPLARVRSLTLQRGFTAERPLLEALLGLACLVLGVVAVRSAVLWMFGSRYVSRSLILLALLLPFGGWLVRDALQRGFYLLAELDDGYRKFPILGELGADFATFIGHAQQVSGKPINTTAYSHPAA
jgi:uncharacterized membrane protein YqjE